MDPEKQGGNYLPKQRGTPGGKQSSLFCLCHPAKWRGERCKISLDIRNTQKYYFKRQLVSFYKINLVYKVKLSYINNISLSSSTFLNNNSFFFIQHFILTFRYIVSFVFSFMVWFGINNKPNIILNIKLTIKNYIYIVYINCTLFLQTPQIPIFIFILG